MTTRPAAGRDAPVPDEDVARVEVCDVCGAPARVHVLRGYHLGTPITARYCLRCSLRAERIAVDAPAPAVRLSLPVLLAVVALIVGLLGGFGDLLVPGGHAGFGWQQRTGVALGAALVLLGALTRADLLAIGGLFIFGLARGGDWFGLARAPGIGWKQQLMLLVGAGLLVAAVMAHLWSRRRRPTPPADAPNARGPQALRTDTLA